jgi:hypothetical protein
MTEPTEIRLSLADLLAELTLGAMAREVEMDESDEDANRARLALRNGESYGEAVGRFLDCAG